jgi:hypothetical protein
VHHADEVIQTKQHRLPFHQHILVGKDRAGHQFWECWMGYDQHRRVYAELAEAKEPQEI